LKQVLTSLFSFENWLSRSAQNNLFLILQVSPAWKMWRKKFVEVVRDVKRTEKYLTDFLLKVKQFNVELTLKENVCTDITKNLVSKPRKMK
jgi:hypothetical protein